MRSYNLDETMNQHSLDRSPYRNMPEKCLKCAYASKPSTLGTGCTMCSGKLKKNDDK